MNDFTLREAVHLGQDLDANLHDVKKIIILGTVWDRYSMKLENYRITNAKVYVFSDSVLCVLLCV